jgi:hypothetical protein
LLGFGPWNTPPTSAEQGLPVKLAVQKTRYRAGNVLEAAPLSKPKEGDCLQREQLAAWFAAVREIPNSVISATLPGLLLTGARHEELGALRWTDRDFQWNTLAIADKVEGEIRQADRGAGLAMRGLVQASLRDPFSGIVEIRVCSESH